MTDIRRRRPTIGFLTANIHVGASRVLWPGLLDAAEAGDVNLICFPGGRLHAEDETEATRNFIYRQVSPDQLDGLVVWTSALAGTASPEEVADFQRQVANLPAVDLASTSGRGPRVTINGSHGMRSLVFHLVEQHGYQRIALIRGPEGHPYASERHRAFLDALTDKGLQPDKRLITPGLGWSKGAEALSVLLDERGLQPGKEFEAVVAASDLLAIGAIRLLVDRGIHVPGDVAVVGFNDIEEGRLVRPPLTSVSLPFYEQGRQAIETLVAMLDGQPVPELVTLDSRLLVRQSCGCPSWSEQMAFADPAPVPAAAAGARGPGYRQTQALLEAQIAHVIRNRGVAATWAKQLLDAFRSEIDSGGNGRFRATLDGILQQGILDGDETSAWQNAVSVLRRELLSGMDDRQRAHAEALFGQARIVIGDAVQRAHIGRQLQAERQHAMLRDIGQELITTFDVEGLVDVLAERLPQLGIRSVYLALHDDPRESPDVLRLLLAYTDGHRFDLTLGGRRYPAGQWLPADLLPRRRHSLLIEPLYFREEPLGIVAFEVGPRDGDIYEVLRGHVSTALKGALLFQKAHEAQITAENADRIKTRLLANVSHELRTPLNIIISHANRLLRTSPKQTEGDLIQIGRSAEHQLRLINDLLDLSRAEINALDLYPMMLDPRALIVDAFTSMARDALPEVTWSLELDDSLPIIEADPVRLRQILLNLLSNAAGATPAGHIRLGADVADDQLHIWVTDTGTGIPRELIDHIYEPFATHAAGAPGRRGIGLGLSITRHLVNLHKGGLEVDSEIGAGSTFHVYLPLPAATPTAVADGPADGTHIWLVSRAADHPADLVEFCRRQQLHLRQLHPDEPWQDSLVEGAPVAVVWDTEATSPEDWQLLRRLHNHPRLHQLPFVLYQSAASPGDPSRLTSLAVKPADSEALWKAIRPSVPLAETGTVLIVDDDPRARRLAAEVVEQELPGYAVRTASDGREGLEAMFDQPPDLVILDLMMPEVDGFEVLEAMRADDRTRHTPVVILSGRRLTLDDVRRLEQYPAVALRSKDVHSRDEIAAALHQSLFGTEFLPPHTSALARKGVAYLHRNFARPLSRQEIGDALGVSEDYFSKMFSRELGISPWDYLNRYRVAEAKRLLRTSTESMRSIARRVGYSDPAYFSRVFSRLAGMSPSDYRKTREPQ